MKTMTFRVSEVESFRQWKHDEEYELDTLLARLRGAQAPSEAMQAGTAFHKALELAQDQTHPTLEAMGYTFRFADDFELEIPSIRELRASKAYVIDDCAVIVTGQVDAICGKRIEDHKTTSRFDADRYLEGYQWRYYLDIFGANRFRWNVFEIACCDDVEPFGLVWDVRTAHRLEQYRYPALTEDCARLAADLASFAKKHLPERIREQSLAA
jgi:hypothetical protein